MRTGDDSGSVLLMGIGWLATCLLAAVVIVDVSAIVVQRQQLQAASDAAALAGAQAIDLADYYAHGATDRTRLEPGAVRDRIEWQLRESSAIAALPGLRLRTAWTDGSQVHVVLSRRVRLPILPGALDVAVPEAQAESWARLTYRGAGPPLAP